MANQPKKYKKFVATAATATLVASAIVPVASAASLSDIAGNTHEEAITALVDAGVINGYPDGTFQPNKTLTRSDVVKLLGKFLVSKGHEVPADYKTNVRFNDLTSASNDELLKYAAVVYDAGVFNGSNGNLLAADNITRENMAVVLVRAFDTLNNIDLVSYVQDQDYKKDVKDLYTAKSEARSAIEVLDFFDITNPAVANFNPKGSTTRGHFATFLYNTMNADFSAVTGVANSAVSEIKAINNTTVEVTFKDAVENIEALDFTIEGLDVKNAVVKQTDAKTVVLTTAAQTGEKVYTLNVNAAKAGTFKGISAVIPTAIKLTTPSVQGTIGQQATVKAEVTVPEGQSKAGIPVTFNIVNATNNQLNEKIEAVAYTNEQGVATYSYTRYYKHNDQVTAYATDKASVYASGTVYWAQSLSITEVTNGTSLANGAKKVYKVKASSEYANGFVNIAFAENVDVTPDKLVRDVTVTDVGTFSNRYPYQVTTGGHQEVQVKLDKNGEATFTLTGSSATVTPIVFVDGYWDVNNVWKNGDGKLEARELQAKAASVTFALSHTLGLTVEPQGKQNAASITGKGTGGRNYLVTLTDKDGKVAPDDAALKVVFPKGSISKDKDVYITVKGTDGKDVARQLVEEDKVYTTYVNGSKGQVTFKLTGDKDAYAAPTVFVDNGSDTNKLDKTDLQTASETTYFVDAVVNTSELTVLDGEGEEVTTVSSAQPAFFEYKSVDQNGFDYYVDNGNYEVTYQVSPQFADVYVSGNGLSSTLVKKGTTASVKVLASAGVANLRVVSADSAIASNVTVSASSSQITLEDQPATVSFSKYAASEKTGLATSVDTAKDELTIDGVLYSYNGASYKYQGSTITKSAFEGYIGGNLANVSVTKDAEGKLTFNVLSVGAAASTKEALQAAIVSAQTLHDGATEGSAEGNYASGSKATLQTAINTALTTYNKVNATPTEIANANTALANAVKAFEDTKVGNQKVALTNAVSEAKTLANTSKAFDATGGKVWGTDNVQGEVQSSNLTALQSEIRIAEAVLGLNGATSSDYATALAALTLDVNAVKTDLAGYTTAKKALTDAITIAERALAAVSIGAGDGQVSVTDNVTLQAEITAATTLANNVTTKQGEFAGAVTALNTAKSTFDGAVINHDVTPVTTSSGEVLTLTFTSTEGVILPVSPTPITLDSATTATATPVAVSTADTLVINVTTPALDQTIVVPVTVNGQAVKLTFTFNGTSWNVTNQTPAGFVETL